MNLIFSPQVSEIGIFYKGFTNLRLHSKNFRGFLKFSEHFRTLLKIFKNFWKFSKSVGRSFWELSDIFLFFPNSDNFWRFKNFSKMLEDCFEHFATISEIFQRFPKTSGNFQRLPKVSKNFQKFSKNFRNLLECLFFCTLWCFFLVSFSKNFQTFNKGDITTTSGNWSIIN